MILGMFTQILLCKIIKSLEDVCYFSNKWKVKIFLLKCKNYSVLQCLYLQSNDFMWWCKKIVNLVIVYIPLSSIPPDSKRIPLLNVCANNLMKRYSPSGIFCATSCTICIDDVQFFLFILHVFMYSVEWIIPLNKFNLIFFLNSDWEREFFYLENSICKCLSLKSCVRKRYKGTAWGMSLFWCRSLFTSDGWNIAYSQLTVLNIVGRIVFYVFLKHSGIKVMYNE